MSGFILQALGDVGKREVRTTSGAAGSFLGATRSAFFLGRKQPGYLYLDRTRRHAVHTVALQAPKTKAVLTGQGSR